MKKKKAGKGGGFRIQQIKEKDFFELRDPKGELVQIPNPKAGQYRTIKHRL